MTQSQTQAADEFDAGAGERLDHVRSTALQLLAGVERPPSILRVQSGDTSVDIEWPEQAASDRPAERTPGPPELLAAAPEAAGGYLYAQTVGVFYPAPEPGAAPFVVEGDFVVAGQQVGIIEAMKLMIPVMADRVGRIAVVLKAYAEPVEYGDRLFGLHAGEPE